VHDHAGGVDDRSQEPTATGCDANECVSADGRLVDLFPVGHARSRRVDGFACTFDEQSVGEAVERAQHTINRRERSSGVTHARKRRFGERTVSNLSTPRM
jgi:hypothetical protein